MANFLQGIQEELGDEVPISFVAGPLRSSWYRDHPHPSEGKVQDWNTETSSVFDYEYDAGYGGEDCHAVTIWTKTRVLFVGCYDGSTWVTSVFRNPTDHIPGMVGG